MLDANPMFKSNSETEGMEQKTNEDQNSDLTLSLRRQKQGTLRTIWLA